MTKNKTLLAFLLAIPFLFAAYGQNQLVNDAGLNEIIQQLAKIAAKTNVEIVQLSPRENVTLATGETVTPEPDHRFINMFVKTDAAKIGDLITAINSAPSDLRVVKFIGQETGQNNIVMVQIFISTPAFDTYSPVVLNSVSGDNAVINGTSYKLGDTIDAGRLKGYKIIEIEKNRVLVQLGNERFYLVIPEN